ncbi:MAG: hypothetical protein VX347_02355 [Bacteroidota bacterium]|nr:hypothetical protein [Bacteroidota bacterium]
MKLNNIIYEKNVIRKNNLVLACVFILLNTIFINNLISLIQAYIILVFLNTLLDSYQKKRPFSNFFNSGLLIGGVSLFFTNTLSFYLIILVTGIVFGSLTWRTLAASLIGLIIPFFFYLMYLFCFDLPINISITTPYNYTLFNATKNILTSPYAIFWIISFMLVFFFSVLELYKWIYKKSIRSRQSFIIIISCLCVCVIASILSNYNIFYFFIIPAGIIITNYLIYYKNRLVAELMFLLLLISSFLYRYMLII